MNLLPSMWGNRFAGKSVMLSQDMSKCGRHALPSLGALGHLLRGVIWGYWYILGGSIQGLPD